MPRLSTRAVPSALGVLTIVVSVTLPGIAQRPSSPSPPATAAISGTVRHAATGRPIAGAVVTLSAPSTALLRGTQRMLSDGLGRFVFRDLPANPRYTLTASRAGFVDGRYGQPALFAPQGYVTLADGQWIANADILLWQPAAITGRIRDEHDDPVVGAFVRVLAPRVIAGRSMLLAGAVARTDDRGEYRLAGLAPGRYFVSLPSAQATLRPETVVSAPSSPGRNELESEVMGFSLGGARDDRAIPIDEGHRLVIGNFPLAPMVNGRWQAYPTTFYPGATTVAGAIAVDVGLSEEKRGIDFAIRPVPTARVAGTVDGPRDLVAGLMLRLMPAGLEALANGSEAATTFVGADGRFAFLNVPAGAYVIDARRSTAELTLAGGADSNALRSPPGAPDRSMSTGEVAIGPPGTGFVRRSPAGTDAVWTRTPVSVAATDITNLVVPVQPTLTVTGRMIFEGTARVSATSAAQGGGRAGATPPTVVVEQAAPPERMPTVEAQPADADLSRGLRTSLSPAVDGDTDTFRIDGLQPGDYVLRVRASVGQYMVKSIHAGGRDVTHGTFSLASGRHVNDVVITFTDRTPSLQGVVQTDASSPAAAVIVFPAERNQWSGYGLSPTRLQSQPAPAGRFRFDALPAGEYFVVAVDAPHLTSWQDPEFLARAAALATRVTLDWGATPSVSLRLARVQ